MNRNERVSVVVMCCDGVYQRYLAKRVADEFDLAGVVRHKTPNAKGSLLSRLSRYRNPVELFRHIEARRLIRGYETQAQRLVESLFQPTGFSLSIPEGTPVVDVENINEDKAVAFVKDLNPDLVCVNGTNLLRRPMLEMIPSLRFGVINLHTGLSPYSRGGNCNLYMLLEGHPELVGLTVHHIDPGVDSGDIIISARPAMEPDDNYEMIEAKTFRLGIDLMLVAIRQLIEGRATRVKQWEKGKLFLRKTGYSYKPYLRVQVNNLLKQGLIRAYLNNQSEIDERVRLVGEHR